MLPKSPPNTRVHRGKVRIHFGVRTGSRGCTRGRPTLSSSFLGLSLDDATLDVLLELEQVCARVADIAEAVHGACGGVVVGVLGHALQEVVGEVLAGDALEALVASTDAVDAVSSACTV